MLARQCVHQINVQIILVNVNSQLVQERLSVDFKPQKLRPQRNVSHLVRDLTARGVRALTEYIDIEASSPGFHNDPSHFPLMSATVPGMLHASTRGGTPPGMNPGSSVGSGDATGTTRTLSRAMISSGPSATCIDAGGSAVWNAPRCVFAATAVDSLWCSGFLLGDEVPPCPLGGGTSSSVSLAPVCSGRRTILRGVPRVYFEAAAMTCSRSLRTSL